MGGRPKNAFKSTTITISASPQVKKYLEQLIYNGLYGQSASEVAKSLVEERLKELLSEGKFLKEVSPPAEEP
jgi:hypothetical protein